VSQLHKAYVGLTLIVDQVGCARVAAITISALNSARILLLEPPRPRGLRTRTVLALFSDRTVQNGRRVSVHWFAGVCGRLAEFFSI
jgi:hypothetical protein